MYEWVPGEFKRLGHAASEYAIATANRCNTFISEPFIDMVSFGDKWPTTWFQYLEQAVYNGFILPRDNERSKLIFIQGPSRCAQRDECFFSNGQGHNCRRHYR